MARIENLPPEISLLERVFNIGSQHFDGIFKSDLRTNPNSGSVTLDLHKPGDTEQGQTYAREVAARFRLILGPDFLVRIADDFESITISKQSFRLFI